MGKYTFSRTAYESTAKPLLAAKGPVTKKAEQKAKKTGKLHPLVDPAGYGVIRRSLPRFDEQDDLWMMTVGVPVAVETRVDTTGSMGGNVDVAIRVLPDAYELISTVLPGKDLQIATGIFGDVSDDFILCRPQFEMTAEKIVDQLSRMVPERAGGDAPEDPHYGLFGAAYLTAASIHTRYGLKSYDFTVTDAPARDELDEKQLCRVFGKDVFEKVIENGYEVDKERMFSTEYVIQDLSKHAHAFVLLVDACRTAQSFWAGVFDSRYVVTIPDTKLLPHAQAVIIGLTEGTINLQNVIEFLTEKGGLDASSAQRILRSVAHIPIGTQAMLPNFDRLPAAGDLFREKTDPWPIDPEELYDNDLLADQTASGEIDDPEDDPEEEGPDWL
ncbi:hypothetical protein ACFL2R_01340 [Patescibacteria group bacterium]